MLTDEVIIEVALERAFVKAINQMIEKMVKKGFMEAFQDGSPLAKKLDEIFQRLVAKGIEK